MASPLDDAIATVKFASGKRKLAEQFLAIGHSLGNGQDPTEIAGDARAALDNLLTQATPVPVLEVTRDGDEFTYSYKSLGLAVGISTIREASDGLHAEVTVVSSVVGSLHWGALNLASTAARETLAKKLERVHPGAPWRTILERACRETAQQFRAGEPAVELTPSDEPLRYAVNKVLVLDEVNEWYGDGDNLKSWDALAGGLSVSRGIPLPCGLTPRIRGPVLFLDYETNLATYQRRLGALMRGFGLEPTQSGIFYRNPRRPLVDDVGQVRAEIVRTGAVLTIVDSFMACIGGMSLLDAGSPTMNALRSLPGTKLLLNHVAKSVADQRGPTRAIGTVVMMNGPRNAWELKAGEKGDSSRTVGFYHAKSNDDRTQRPFALRYEFSETSTGVLTVRIGAGDASEDPDLASRTSLADRLLHALKIGQQTVEELAEETESAPGTIRKELSRLRKTGKIVQLDEVRGRKNVWGLRYA